MNPIFKIYTQPIHLNLWNNSYGLARTLLALSTLTTLLFNHTNILFSEGVGITPPLCYGITKISLYCIFNTQLEVGRWISIALLLVVASGWRPRITGVLHWWVAFSLNSSALILEGGDQVASNLTLLLIPITLLDPRKWHWKNHVIDMKNITWKKDLSIWCAASTYFIIRLQVALIYFNAAVEKFKVDEWLNGTALYYWFLNPYMGANEAMTFLLKPLITHHLITPLLTWGTLLFELMLFLGIALPARYRIMLLKSGILFHLIIAFVHGLFPFFFSMTAALILFLKPLNTSFNLSRYQALTRFVGNLFTVTPTPSLPTPHPTPHETVPDECPTAATHSQKCYKTPDG